LETHCDDRVAAVGLALESQFEDGQLGPPGGHIADGLQDFHLQPICAKVDEYWQQR
jgi:hypothetical protein